MRLRGDDNEKKLCSVCIYLFELCAFCRCFNADAQILEQPF